MLEGVIKLSRKFCNCTVREPRFGLPCPAAAFVPTSEFLTKLRSLLHTIRSIGCIDTNWNMTEIEFLAKVNVELSVPSFHNFPPKVFHESWKTREWLSLKKFGVINFISLVLAKGEVWVWWDLPWDGGWIHHHCLILEECLFVLSPLPPPSEQSIPNLFKY